MSLFTLLKISRTRYLLKRKQVPGDTPGAKKVTEESRHWYAYRRDGEKQIKIKLFTDKAASMTELLRLNTALERGEAGMVNPRKEHLERSAFDHLDEFVPVMRANGKSEKDKDRKEAILRAFVTDSKLRSLSDLNPSVVDRYLASVKDSTGNKKKHLSAISIWVKWLLKKDRIESNPLFRVDIPSGGKKVKERRALAADAIQKLLDAARERPHAAYRKRYGDEIRDEVRGRLARIGRERSLIYKMAVFTGLRLGEIAALRPCHLTFSSPLVRQEKSG